MAKRSGCSFLYAGSYCIYVLCAAKYLQPTEKVLLLNNIHNLEVGSFTWNSFLFPGRVFTLFTCVKACLFIQTSFRVWFPWLTPVTRINKRRNRIYVSLLFFGLVSICGLGNKFHFRIQRIGSSQFCFCLFH